MHWEVTAKMYHRWMVELSNKNQIFPCCCGVVGENCKRTLLTSKDGYEYRGTLHLCFVCWITCYKDDGALHLIQTKVIFEV
jgi:hypothetical protein